MPLARQILRLYTASLASVPIGCEPRASPGRREGLALFVQPGSRDFLEDAVAVPLAELSRDHDPGALLLAEVLMFLVRSVRRGELDDMEGPAEHHAFDDDRCPEKAEASSP